MPAKNPTGYFLPLTEALFVIDAWLIKQEPHMWDHDHVKAKLRTTSINGLISYRDATTILGAAASPKMVRDANAGINFIKQRWSDLKILHPGFPL